MTRQAVLSACGSDRFYCLACESQSCLIHHTGITASSMNEWHGLQHMASVTFHVHRWSTRRLARHMDLGERSLHVMVSDAGVYAAAQCLMVVNSN